MNESITTPSASSSGAAPGTHASSSRAWWTAAIGLLFVLLLFRWVVFAAIKYLVRERIRLRYLGPRGIRGLHFRQDGFKGAAAQEKADDAAGLSVKLQQVTVQFNGFRNAPDAAPAESKALPAAWLTLAVRGVSVQVSPSSAKKPPPSKAAHTPTAPASADSTSTPPPSPTSSAPGASRLCTVRDHVLRLARPLLFLIASALPTLTRLIDVELHRVEIHLLQKQAVVRVAHVRLGLRVEMVDGKEAHTGSSGAPFSPAGKRPTFGPPDSRPGSRMGTRNASLDHSAAGAAATAPAPSQKSFSSLLHDVPARVGHGAREVVSFLVTGLPEARVTTVLEWAGLQAFDVADLSSPKSTSKTPGETRWRAAPTTWQETWEQWSVAEHDRAISFIPASEASWHPRGQAPERISIPASHRLAFAPAPSFLTLHTSLGPHFFHLKAHRAFTARCELAEHVVGLEALTRIQGRRTSTKKPEPEAHSEDRPKRRKQKNSKATMRAVVAAISSVHFDLERLRILHEAPFDAVVENFTVALSSARPDEPDCTQWLHTRSNAPSHTRSGTSERASPSPSPSPARRPSSPDVQAHTHATRLQTLRNSLSDKIRSPASRSTSPSLHVHPRAHHAEAMHEPRRVFRLAAGIDSVAVRHSFSSSDVVRVEAIRADARSTWTPFGFCPSIRGGSTRLPRAMQLQAIDMAVLLRTSISSISVNLSPEVLAALPKSQKSTKRAAAPSEKSTTVRFPELHASLDVAAVHLAFTEKHDARPSLELDIPTISLVTHASYREAPPQRTEAARRSAWKAFERDSLEWKRSANAQAQVSPAASSHHPKEGPLKGAEASHALQVSACLQIPSVKVDVAGHQNASIELLGIDDVTLSCDGALAALDGHIDDAPLVTLSQRWLRSSVVVQGVRADVTDAAVWALLDRLITRKAETPAQEQPIESEPPAKASPLRKFPRDISVNLAILKTSLRAATIDSKRDSAHPAGVALEWSVLSVDIAHRTSRLATHLENSKWAARAAIELGEDSTFSAATLAAKHGQAAVARVSLAGLVLSSIDPPAARASPSRYQTPYPPPRNDILVIPTLTVKAAITPAETEKVELSVNIPRPITFKIELANTYLLMLVGGRVKELLGKGPPKPKKAQAKAALDIKFMLDCERLDAPIHLPGDMEMFMGISKLRVWQTPQDLLDASFDSLVGAVHFEKHGMRDWEEVFLARDWRITASHDKPPQVAVQGDSATFHIPHLFEVHSIIQATKQGVKATKHLVHEFLKGEKDYVLRPSAVKPVHLPPISLRLRTLIIEAADDPLEVRLGLLWGAGRLEAQARLERDAAFIKRISVMATGESEPMLDVIQDARKRLDMFNSDAWVRRLTKARLAQERREEGISKRNLGRFQKNARPGDWPIQTRARPAVPPIFRSTMRAVDLAISKPNYGVENAQEFINSQGDKIPKGMEFSIMVPMHLDWKMGEWRWDLRDYPLPLLHVPPVVDSNRPAWETSFDMCIAEQMGGEESTLHFPACIAHVACTDDCKSAYIIQVPKVVMPTKIFGSPDVYIHSTDPTRLCWGQSVQPTISDMVRVFDGFSSPQYDPSPKVGFWDKVRRVHPIGNR